jgi:hypothetical protein
MKKNTFKFMRFDFKSSNPMSDANIYFKII